MSVSIDFKKMEKLASLEQALELLQNPESYTRLLAEVKSVTTAYNMAAAKHASVEAAEGFLSESRKLLESVKKETKEMREVLERDQREFNTLVATRTSELDSRTGSVVQMEQHLKGRQLTLNRNVVEHEQREAEFKTMIEKKMAALANRETKVHEDEQKMAAKMVAFAEIVKNG